MKNIQICCPKCGWEPDGKAYWRCTCGHQWNTFATGGRCPECKRVWQATKCIHYAGGCTSWSLHLDWYKGLEDVIAKLKKEIIDGWNVSL